jgi:transposase
MSDINYTSTLLNLKDQNLDFSDSRCEMSTIKGIETMVITAVLKNKPGGCPHCGGRHINVHGCKTANIKIPPISKYYAILRLKKQRYRCKNCRKTFMAETSVVNKNCFISNNTKLAVSNIASQKISEKDIALKYNISHNTVSRVINSFYEMHKVNYSYLPKALCFDEFKSAKDADSAMSFIFADALSAIKHKNSAQLEYLISKQYDNISDYMKIALATVKKYKPYIINAVRYNLSNGLFDGINNKIKTIKRIAFGYRSFYNFKNRILIACHLIGIKNVT